MNLYDYIERVCLSVWFNFKSFIKQPVELSLCIFIVTLVLLIPTIFAPVEYSLGMSISFMIFAISLLTYKKLCLDYDESTLSMNEKIHSNKRGVRTVTSIITVIIINIIMYTIFSLGLSTISNFYHLSNTFINVQSEDYSYIIPFFYNYSYYIYNVILLSFISFTILLISSKFITSTKGITMFGICILIVIFLYGGLFNNYFYISNYNIELNGQPRFRSLLFPEYVFVPSLFIPFYPQSQMMSSVAVTCRTDFEFFEGVNELGLAWGSSPWIWADKIFYDWAIINKEAWIKSQPWKWNILWILPYVHIIVLSITSKIIGIIKK